jgi:plastocyanin
MRMVVLIALLGAGVVAGALPALAADHAVTASGTSFSPKSITIAKGDSVTWTNGGGTHDVHFDDGFTNGPPATATWPTQRTFDTPGTYSYYCDQHQAYGMTGTVVVTEATTTTDPVVTPTPTPTPTPTVARVVPKASALSVTRKVKAGRMRGKVTAEPAGATLTVRVSAGGRSAGSTTRTVAAAGPVAFSVKLSKAARRTLARRGKLKVVVRATVAAGGTTATKKLGARLR